MAADRTGGGQPARRAADQHRIVRHNSPNRSPPGGEEQAVQALGAYQLMFRYFRVAFVTVLALYSLAAGLPARVSAAQQCFPETGQCIAGPIRAY